MKYNVSVEILLLLLMKHNVLAVSNGTYFTNRSPPLYAACASRGGARGAAWRQNLDDVGTHSEGDAKSLFSLASLSVLAGGVEALAGNLNRVYLSIDGGPAFLLDAQSASDLDAR